MQIFNQARATDSQVQWAAMPNEVTLFPTLQVPPEPHSPYKQCKGSKQNCKLLNKPGLKETESTWWNVYGSAAEGSHALITNEWVEPEYNFGAGSQQGCLQWPPSPGSWKSMCFHVNDAGLEWD